MPLNRNENNKDIISSQRLFFIFLWCETIIIKIQYNLLKPVDRNTSSFILGILTAILVVAGISSCGRKGKVNNQNSSADTRRIACLNAIDDSINKRGMSARAFIEEGMRKAEDSTEWCEYAVRLGKLYYKANQPDSMMKYISKVRRYAEKQPVSPRTNNILGLADEYEAGWKQLMQRGVAEVIDLHKRAYDRLSHSDNKISLSDITANIGDCYYLSNNILKAAAYYRRALFLVDSLQLPKEKNITLYMGLARIYENLGDLTEAERFYKQSEKFLNSMQPGMQTYFLSSFGSYYYKTKQFKKSLSYFKRMESFVAREEGDSCFDMALCRINAADVYLNMNNIKKAEEYLNASEPFFRNNKIDVGIHYANSIRIGILLKQKRYSDIKQILNNEHISGKIEYAIQKIRNEYLREYFIASGNPAAALKNKMEEDRKEDSIAKSNSYMRASEVIQRFSEDTLALHHEIAMTEKEHKEQLAKTTIIMLSAGIVILLLILAVWWMYVRKKQLSAQMERFLLRLENTRNRISPHFIFNILNNRIYTAGQKEKDELMSLAQLIRKSLDISRDTFITLEQELDFVKKYIEVQSYVLRPDFKFKLTVPDDISDIHIPSMSIQILAENAIKHGLKGLDRQQKLWITVNRSGSVISITVEDNGRGFDSTKGSGNGLGMNIIRQTIAAVNRRSKKGKMDMDVSNTHDEKGNVTGCRITMTINGKINFDNI